MASKHNKKPDVKSILAAKKFAKPRFTQDEKTIILRSQQQALDKLLKQEIDTFAKNTVKPWVDDFALFEKRKKSNKGKGGLDQLRASEIIRSLNPPDRIASFNPGSEAPQCGSSSGILSDQNAAGCTGVFIIEPPYDDGDPVVEVRVPNELPTNTHDSSSALVVPADGIISLGVGAGRFVIDEVYPAPYDWFFGKYNRVEGSLIHTVLLPSPLIYATRVTVTAEFKVGEDWQYEAGNFALVPSHPGDGLGDGPAIVLGNTLLRLHGDPAMNSGSGKLTNFLQRWKSRSMSCWNESSCRNLRSFSTTTSLDLLPGASSFTIVISAVLQALLTQVPGAELNGFAAADFMSPYMRGLWFLSGGRGGAIKVPRIRMSFCRVGIPLDIPVDIL